MPHEACRVYISCTCCISWTFLLLPSNQDREEAVVGRYTLVCGGVERRQIISKLHTWYIVSYPIHSNSVRHIVRYDAAGCRGENRYQDRQRDMEGKRTKINSYLIIRATTATIGTHM